MRHLLQLTPMSTEAFEYFAGRAQPHKDSPVYKANGMDQELAAIRARLGTQADVTMRESDLTARSFDAAFRAMWRRFMT